MPSTDARWIIGVILVVGGLLYNQNSDLAGRMDHLEVRMDRFEARIDARIDWFETTVDARIDRLETRLDGFDTRLRAIDVGFGKVEQRLLTLEGILLDTGDGR
jgi:hypothetical protein